MFINSLPQYVRPGLKSSLLKFLLQPVDDTPASSCPCLRIKMSTPNALENSNIKMASDHICVGQHK